MYRISGALALLTAGSNAIAHPAAQAVHTHGFEQGLLLALCVVVPAIYFVSRLLTSPDSWYR